MPYAPPLLASRIHDGVMQLLGTALLKTELCEQLARFGRADEIPDSLTELRSALEDTLVELRSLMTDLQHPPAQPKSLEDQAA